LHLNGWGFVQAFEKFCWAQEWHCSSMLFRVLFQPYRKDKKKKEWISLRQNDNPSLFTYYEESFKDWKSSYIKIVPRSKVAFRRDHKGRDLFPLYWSKSHYSLPNSLKQSCMGFWKKWIIRHATNCMPFSGSIISQSIAKMWFMLNLGATTNVAWVTPRSHRMSYLLCVISYLCFFLEDEIMNAYTAHYERFKGKTKKGGGSRMNPKVI
jgi:hypothetical protein